MSNFLSVFFGILSTLMAIAMIFVNIVAKMENIGTWWMYTGSIGISLICIACAIGNFKQIKFRC